MRSNDATLRRRGRVSRGPGCLLPVRVVQAERAEEEHTGYDATVSGDARGLIGRIVRASL